MSFLGLTLGFGVLEFGFWDLDYELWDVGYRFVIWVLQTRDLEMEMVAMMNGQ